MAGEKMPAELVERSVAPGHIRGEPPTQVRLVSCEALSHQHAHINSSELSI